MAFVTMVVTSWLLSVAGAEFSPGCSFSAGQCQYNVQLGHQGSCDTSGGSHCCDAIRGQVSGLADDVGTLKSQMSTLMSELTASKHNLTQVTGKLSEAEAATQQLLHTLAQKEAELNTTRSDLSQIMRSAKEEINTLRVNLTRVNSELNTCRASLGLPTTTSSIPDSSTFPDGVELSLCTFDHYLNDTCQFTNTTGHKGFTPGSGQQRVDTGPRQDHTLGSPHGKYLFVDPNVGFDSTSSSLKTVSMTSREFPPSSGYCIYAWYNMYGKDIQDFALYIKVGAGKGYPVISRHGDQGHEWKLAKADLDYEYTSSPFSIEISGTTQAYRLYSYVGGHRQKIWFRNLSKVAVDDIYIYNTRCKNIPVCPRHGITRSFGNQTMCYTFHTQPATWYEAATRCRREGPHFSLVTIKSQEEQMFITRTIKGDPALSAAGQLGFWTAGNDERHEHTFDWTDTGTPYQGTYSNWRAGQPNNFAGDQDCLLLEFPDLDYQWGDQECHERHPYICKSVHPTPSPPTTPPTALIG